MKILYLIAAIIGAVVPFIYYVDHFQASGTSLGVFIDAITINAASRGLTADVLIASFVFWAFMIHRHRFRHGPNPILFIVVNLAIGLSCALPAYLFAMERQREAHAAAG